MWRGRRWAPSCRATRGGNRWALDDAYALHGVGVDSLVAAGLDEAR